MRELWLREEGKSPHNLSRKETSMARGTVAVNHHGAEEVRCVATSQHHLDHHLLIRISEQLVD